MHVFGHEHYAEHLEDLACAAVPICHPVSGKAAGAVNLTCWRKDADALLLALAKTAAGQITQALLTDASARESRLLQEYLRASPAHRRDRRRADQRPGADERPRPGRARPRRPGRALGACRRGAGRRPRWPGGCRAADRGQGADVLPAAARAGPAAARRRCRAREAVRADGRPARGRCGGRAAGAQVRAWARLRSAVAARVPSGGCGARLG